MQTNMKTRRQFRPTHALAPNRAWNPAHFPSGTVIKIEDCYSTKHLAERNGGSFEFVVDHLVQNGSRSWCAVTTVDEDRRVFGEGAKVSFNLAWVENIVSRGQGPVVIQPPYSNKDPRDVYNPNNADEAHLITVHRLTTGKGYRGHYVFYTFERLKFLNLVKSVTGDVSGSFDIGAMIEVAALTHPEWIADINCLSEHWLVAKRDLQRWIKQNANRFRRSVDSWAAREREIDEQEYQRMINDDDYPDGDGIGDDPGSCYDPDNYDDELSANDDEFSLAP